MKADVEVVFCFDEKKELYDGYRPSHLIDGKNLTTGVHHYFDSGLSQNTVKGTITFIAPEDYPNSLKIGDKIDMFEGSKKIGFAEILEIFNPILGRNESIR
ncbi:MAG: hypothetical protein J5537_05780 [Lachnospiraceae bacterium]|nr:hypothetical protein [Lachnospiraceae bacterium]